MINQLFKLLKCSKCRVRAKEKIGPLLLKRPSFLTRFVHCGSIRTFAVRRYRLAGLVSFGVECGRDRPGIVVNPADPVIKKWIVQVTFGLIPINMTRPQKFNLRPLPTFPISAHQGKPPVLQVKGGREKV